MNLDNISRLLRAAAILTGSFVAVTVSSVLEAGGPRLQDFNQLVIYVDYTPGSLTSADLKFEFAPADAPTDFYQETNESASVASNVDTRGVNTVIHRLTIAGKYRFAFPIADGDVKVSAMGNGTAAGSSMKITAGLGKTFA